MLDILTNPPIQFFLLAVIAGLVRSDLEIPEQVTKAMSMYLMIAIGLKGGLALQAAPIASISAVWLIFILAILISFLLPFIGYGLLRTFTQLSRTDAAAVAAHYGSVSVVTFSFAVNFLEGRGYSYQGYIVTLMALMEAPAILSAILLARDGGAIRNTEKTGSTSTHVIREALFNSSIVLLIGSMVIGFTANPQDMARISPYLIKPFYAVLCVFLLELGLISSKQMRHVRHFPVGLFCFAFIMPLIGATIAGGTALLVGLGFAESVLFTVLGASASYIAVPAAMKLALPQANPMYYVTSSLVLTFPFNLIIGVPLYYHAIKYIF